MNLNLVHFGMELAQPCYFKEKIRRKRGQKIRRAAFSSEVIQGLLMDGLQMRAAFCVHFPRGGSGLSPDLHPVCFIRDSQEGTVGKILKIIGTRPGNLKIH